LARKGDVKVERTVKKYKTRRPGIYSCEGEKREELDREIKCLFTPPEKNKKGVFRSQFPTSGARASWRGWHKKRESR